MTPDHHSLICLLNVSFQIYSMFAMILRSNLLGNLFTGCWSLAVAILLRSVTDVGEASVPVNSKGVELEPGLCSGHFFFQSNISLHTMSACSSGALCTGALSSAENCLPFTSNEGKVL